MSIKVRGMPPVRWAQSGTVHDGSGSDLLLVYRWSPSSNMVITNIQTLGISSCHRSFLSLLKMSLHASRLSLQLRQSTDPPSTWGNMLAGLGKAFDKRSLSERALFIVCLFPRTYLGTGSTMKGRG